MRRAAKVDWNQGDIVEALRAMGATVQPLHAVGQGCPDLLCGWRGSNILIEIKNPAGRGNKLTDDQVIWHRDWCGQVAVVTTADEAISLLLERR